MSFRLTKLELREVRIPFRFTFKHALAERREANNLILTVYSDTGHAGYGESLARPYLTGETVVSAWDDIKERWWPAVRSLAYPQSLLPTDALRPVYQEADEARRTGSYGGVDIAIYDLWGRVTATAGSRLFGQTPTSQVLTCPLGGGGPRSIKWISRASKVAGFRDFKLKTGRPDDELRLRMAREVLGPQRDIRVDANAARTVEESLAMAETLRRYNVSSLEQPIPAGDVEGLARIQHETGIDVMADESLCSREDARRLIDADATKLWNLRLAKVGGFTGFLELLDMAKRAGVRIHHGVLVGESTLLAAAARACSGLTDFAHVEYGFPEILLRVQPFRGGPGGIRGVGRPLIASAGLGLKPDKVVLDKVTVRKLELEG